MDEHGAAGLCRHDEEHGEQVGGQTRPGSIGERHDRAVEERVDDIMSLVRDDKVVTFLLHLHTQPAESVGNRAEVAHRYIFNTQSVAHHGSHADERSHLDHVRQDTVVGSVKLIDPHDGEEVAGNARDVGTHPVEQMAELLNIRLTGRVVDGRGAFRHDSCHDDVGGTGDRCLVEQHVGAFESIAVNLINVAYLIEHKLRPEVLEAEEVRVEAPAPDLVASGLGYRSLAEAAEQRSVHQHGSAQL